MRWRVVAQSIEQVIQVAKERLETAQFGLEDMLRRPERFQSGLCNAVVFGRAVTFALQNLRSVVDNFDDWYCPMQEQMRCDPLMRYFHDLRTEIEKTVNRHTSTSVFIRSFNSTTDMQRFQPAPPRATSFFMGDQNGGCGWEVQRADGSTEKYYIDLPSDIGEVTVHLHTVPEQFRNTPATDLLAAYLDKLEALITSATEHFLPKK